MGKTMSDNSFLFNVQKPPYKKLDEVLPDYLFEKPFMNVFIDSEFILTNFFVENFKEMASRLVAEKDATGLAIEIINYIGHFRNYFGKAGIGTRFFLLHSFHDDTMQELGYHDYMKRKESKQCHPSTIRFLDFVIEKRVRPFLNSVPDVYLLNPKKVDRTATPFILHESILSKKGRKLFANTKMKNLFLTYDKRFIQYLYLFNEATIFNGNSCVNISNPFDHITKKYKNVKRISPYAIVPYLSLMGFDGIPPLFEEFAKKPRKVIGLFEDVDVNLENYNKLDLVCNLLSDEKLVKISDLMEVPNSLELENRLYSIDIIGKANTLITKDKVNETIDCFDRVEPDVDYLYEMNDEFFDSAIDLTMLV